MDLQKLKVVQLRKLARRAGIKKPQTKKKATLIKLLSSVSRAPVQKAVAPKKVKHTVPKSTFALRPDFAKVVLGDPNFKNYPNFVRYQLRPDPNSSYGHTLRHGGLYNMQSQPFLEAFQQFAKPIKST